MSVARQLYRLQEVDQELESSEQTYSRISSQIGENKTVIDTRNRLESERSQLDEATHQQHSVEWEIEGISTKLANVEEELYSGRTTSPKELTNLQHEIDGLKANRGKLEDQALEIMEKVEQTKKSVSSLETELKRLETEWQSQQKELSAELKELETAIAGLKDQRESLAAEIDPQVIDIYNELKRQRGTSVARVEQGICRGCRISLPVTELQRVRSGDLVRCSSCGRILFLA
jgi:predicted  nucleic acid-binding Zn-ribbon protein